MPGNLHFDVDATNSASDEFVQVAAELTEVANRLKALDGKTARAKVDLAVAGAAALTKLQAQLAAIPERTKTTVNVDVDRDAPTRLSSLASGVSRLSTVANAAAPAVSKLREAAKVIVDPASIPIVERASDAIANKFHRAVQLAEPVVGKLRTTLVGLRTGLLGVAAAGAAVQVIGAVTTTVSQLSGAALLLPAALLGGAVAVTTLKTAFAGFGDAVKAKDAKEFAEATKDMAPAARATAVAVRGLRDQFVSVQQVVQKNLFAGMADQVRALGATYMPILRTGLGAVATQLGGMGTAALTAVRSLSTIGNVQRIIGNTSLALGSMRNTLANAVTGFLTLGAAGSSWLPRLGSAIDSAAAKFNSWAQRITSDGSFDRWVGRAITAISQVGSIVGNVGSIVAAVFRAMNVGGADFLGTLVRVTGQVKEFVRSAEGAQALTALARALAAAGDAAQRILAAALRQLGPILIALAPLAQAFATAIGDHLVAIINVAGPVLQRFAAFLSEHPALLLAVAKAAAAVVIGFTPMVAIIGVAATVLKGMLLAAVVSAAMAQLGMSGTVLARVLGYVARPMTLLRDLAPLVARGFGMLVAQLGIMAGPIGVLIVAFATLYATSDQFRAAVDSLGRVLGGLFVTALRQAGEIINSTVLMLQRFGSAAADALSGLGDVGRNIASVFGPAGKVVEDVLTGVFNSLGKLPGAVLAAFAAFKVFGLVAPIFTTASAAVAGFAARMAAFQSSSAVATAAANGVGRAAGAVSTALTKLGSALPLIGVALIALGYAYDAVRSRADDFAQSVVQGSMSMQQAIQQQAAIYSEGFSGIVNAALGGAVGMQRWRDANLNAAMSAQEVRAAVEAQLQTMGPLEQAQARVAISQQNLNDAILTYGATSQQARDATAVLARDKADLAAKEKVLEQATRGTTEAMQAQADQMSGQVNSALAYAASVRETAEAQKAAEAAIRKNGIASDEAQKSIEQVANSFERQAENARRQAEALGGAGAGLEAYNTELQRMDRSSQSGRAAFAMLASGLDSTGLAALSAAAKASGLRTEIMTLPDGRKVTVVVEADRQKLDTVKQQVTDLTAKPYIGTVTLRGETEGFRGQVTQSLQFANGQTATLKIAGDGSPALLTVGQTKYTIDATTGTIKVKGNVAPGEADLSGLKLKVDTTTGVMTLAANDASAAATTFAAKQRVDTSVGTMTLDGNPTLVNGKTTAAVTFANGQTGVITLDGQPDPVTGKINASVKYANGQTGRITIDGNDGPVRSKVAGTVAWINSQRPSITVSVQYSGSSPAAVRAAGSGGLVMGFSGGGVIGGPIRRYSRGGIIPGYGPGVDDQLALISRGESVLVPELTRALGATRIMAANAEASGGRPGMAVGQLAGLMDGTLGTGTRRAGGTAGPSLANRVTRQATNAARGSAPQIVQHHHNYQFDASFQTVVPADTAARRKVLTWMQEGLRVMERERR